MVCCTNLASQYTQLPHYINLYKEATWIKFKDLGLPRSKHSKTSSTSSQTQVSVSTVTHMKNAAK